MEFILNLSYFYLFDWKFEDLYFLFYKPNGCTLKIRRPLFFPWAPDWHWACNLFRRQFSSNSFQIHFKLTSNLLANSLIFSYFFLINLFQFVSKNLQHFSICFNFPSKAKKSALKWSKICRRSFKWDKTHCVRGFEQLGWNRIFFIPSFIPGWDLVSVTCKCTLTWLKWVLHTPSQIFDELLTLI